MVLWHVAQFAAAKGAPAVACVGLLVCCQVVKWHPEFPQSFGVILRLYLLLMWQDSQDGTLPPLATRACEFVSGNPNAAWSNLPSDHFVMAWHWAQAAAVDGKPALM